MSAPSPLPQSHVFQICLPQLLCLEGAFWTVGATGCSMLIAHTTITLVQLFSQGWHLHFTFPAEIFQIAKVHWKRLESQHSTRRKLTNLGQCQGPLSSYIPTNILQCTQPFAINLYSTWWDPKGVCRPLHSMNRLRVPLVREGLLQVSYGT